MRDGCRYLVITGDIDAMLLRDSSAQVWPYLPLMKDDDRLRQMIAGVIRRQTQCILIDPYANAFYPEPNPKGEWITDKTDMKPEVHERKWEIDSLCYPIRLVSLLEADHPPLSFRRRLAEGHTVLKTFKEQQRKENHGHTVFCALRPSTDKFNNGGMETGEPRRTDRARSVLR